VRSAKEERERDLLWRTIDGHGYKMRGIGTKREMQELQKRWGGGKRSHGQLRKLSSRYGENAGKWGIFVRKS